MDTYRIWQPSDLPWLERAAAQAAWESASAEERSAAAPEFVAMGAGQQLRAVLGMGMGTVIIARAGEQPVGFLLFTAGPDASTSELNGLLTSLWVEPGHRRRGVARRLLALAEGILGHMGIRKAKIWTGLHNQSAVNLARQAGYLPEGLIGMKSI